MCLLCVYVIRQGPNQYPSCALTYTRTCLVECTPRVLPLCSMRLTLLLRMWMSLFGHTVYTTTLRHQMWANLACFPFKWLAICPNLTPTMLSCPMTFLIMLVMVVCVPRCASYQCTQHSKVGRISTAFVTEYTYFQLLVVVCNASLEQCIHCFLRCKVKESKTLHVFRFGEGEKFVLESFVVALSYRNLEDVVYCFSSQHFIL